MIRTQGKSHISIQILDGMKPVDHPWNKDGGEVVNISESIIPDRLARVRYAVGMTLNLGDYQSARVDVGIELPADVDKTDEVYEQAVEFCNDRLMEEVENLYQLKKK